MYHKLFHIAEHSCLRLCYSLLDCATCTHRLCHIHHSLLDCATFTPRLCDMHSSPVPHLLYDCATFPPRLCHIHSSTVPHSLIDCATFTPRLCHIHSSTVPRSSALVSRPADLWTISLSMSRQPPGTIRPWTTRHSSFSASTVIGCTSSPSGTNLKNRNQFQDSTHHRVITSRGSKHCRLL